MKSQLAKAVWASPHNFGFELCSFKDEVLSVSDLSARANQRFPEIRLNAACQQNLDPRAQIFPRTRIVLPNWFGATSQAVRKESGGDDPCVVYDNQFVASKPRR